MAHQKVSIGSLLIPMMLAGLESMSVCGCQQKNVAMIDEKTVRVEVPKDRSYERLPPLVDPEHRAEPLADSTSGPCDTTALAGMPQLYIGALTGYTRAVIEAIHASPLMRRRFYHSDRSKLVGVHRGSEFPDDANPIFDRDVVIPLVILARPDAVNTWSATSEAATLGWRTEEEAAKNRGSVYGRTLIFEPGETSQNPQTVPAAPLGSRIPSWELYMADQDTSYFLKMGKLVDSPEYDYSKHNVLGDRAAVLRLGERTGGKLLAEFVTVPAYVGNTRLRWASIRSDSEMRRFLAYALLDGNGARRARNVDMLTDSKTSPYVRPLICERHQPKIKQHDELLLPAPLGWPPTFKEWSDSRDQSDPHEEWCLDEWFPAQKEACWVIREAEDSKPLQESFLLMAANEKSDRPVFFVALFAETEPKQLVKELAALYNVSPDEALDSNETMARLNSLYEKVRDFPLGK